MPIALVGNVNVSALSVPQILVQIVPPQFLFNGVATNVCGLVGTANWGPVNLATPFGNYAQYASIFGPTINRTYDMGGHVQLAVAQGAGYFTGVRVTDGTDTAASVVIPGSGATSATGTITFSVNPVAASTITLQGTVWTFVASITGASQILIGATLAATLSAAVATLNASSDTNTAKMTYAASATVITATAVLSGTAGNAYTLAASVATAAATLSGGVAGTTGITLTAKYTGSLGNSLKVTFAKGQAANSYNMIVSCTGLPTEIYNSVASNLTGLPVWTALTGAINSGSSTVRPPSNLVVATVGTATTLPILGTYSLSGGTDGVTAITTSVLLGSDASPRSGMYALRNQGVAQFTLCDCSDLTSLSTQIAYGTDIGAYVIMASPASDTLTNASTSLSQYGIDSFIAKVLFGDWIIWLDSVNGVPNRMTSPAAVSIGFFGNSSPQRNSLNKPINGIVGTQSTLLGKTYGYSDFQTLAAARMDIITLDKTITNNFVHRLGINTSSNPVIMGDEYTRVTFFLAKSINVIGAQYIGANMTATEMLQAKVALQQFLQLAQTNGIIYTFNGSQAYQVVLDTSNNTQATAALGYQYAYVKAIIGPIVRYFIINLEGGSSVTISATPPGG